MQPKVSCVDLGRNNLLSVEYPQACASMIGLNGTMYMMNKSIWLSIWMRNRMHAFLISENISFFVYYLCLHLCIYAQHGIMVHLRWILLHLIKISNPLLALSFVFQKTCIYMGHGSHFVMIPFTQVHFQTIHIESDIGALLLQSQKNAKNWIELAC